MAMSRSEMDRRMDQHFAFEAQDDVAGVLATLAPDAEHDIVGWPTGPTHGRDAARPFYEALFADLVRRQGRVHPPPLRRRLPGRRVDVARQGAGPAVRPRGQGPAAAFRLLHVIEFAADGAMKRENVWIDMGAVLQQLPQD